LQIRVRLGAGLSRFAGSPLLALEVPDGGSIEDLFAALGERHPELAPALPSALPVVGGTHVERDAALHPGDEVALLIPVAGGAGQMRGA
jgi:molybdopterin converting factor small subunit